MGYSIKGYCNPADEFMKFLSVNYPKQTADEQKIEKFVSHYESKIRKEIESASLEFKIDSAFLNDRSMEQASF
jgi:hypothetical protein